MRSNIREVEGALVILGRHIGLCVAAESYGPWPQLALCRHFFLRRTHFWYSEGPI